MQQESSLERGLAILEAVTVAGDHTPANIAGAIGIPTSTVYRYLRTLKNKGLVIDNHGKFEPGPALFSLAGRNNAHSALSAIGPALLAEVVDQTGETALLLTRIGVRAMCLCKVEPNKTLKYSFLVNQILPLNAGAGQKVLLAGAPSKLIQKVIDNHLTQFTPATLDGPGLKQSLIDIRQQGYAISRGEFEAGSISVAVPVIVGGELVCSLDVAGPQARCDSPRWIQKTLTVLGAAAQRASHELEMFNTELGMSKKTTEGTA